LRLDFVARVRDEQKFPSVDALKSRIAADLVEARRLLAGASIGAR
jgi:riboflavin kinase / FMN adenylyltransferase